MFLWKLVLKGSNLALQRWTSPPAWCIELWGDPVGMARTWDGWRVKRFPPTVVASCEAAHTDLAVNVWGKARCGATWAKGFQWL
jgi:hypothetical protein